MASSQQPFARRIAVSFTLMTALVSGVFSFGIFAALLFTEEYLVSQELSRELAGVLNPDVAADREPRLDANTVFYSSADDRHPIPPAFRNLREGFAEVESDGNAYWAYTRIVDGHSYLLVEEQNEFERRERVLFLTVFIGFLLSVAGAWVLGHALARRVMAPVSRLAYQVRDRDQLHEAAPALAPDYAPDEVGQLATAFDGTLGKFRQALERERLFTGDVSHELRTPLMIIASSCELLMEAPLAAQQQEQVARIARATAEMRELVQTFLQLARDKSNAIAPVRDSLLAVVAEDEFRHWSELMAEKGLEFRLLVEEHDDDRYNGVFLRCVMTNLLRNALHYTDHGFVRLVLERGAFRVEDSGPGIEPGEDERIFESFKRGSRARGEGLGLGLSLVRRICTHQGWRVGVHSEPGGGSTFRVVLQDRS